MVEENKSQELGIPIAVTSSASWIHRIKSKYGHDDNKNVKFV